MNIFEPASDVCAPSMLQRRSLQLISLTSGPTPGVVADFSPPLLIFAAQRAWGACGRPESSASLLRWEWGGRVGGLHLKPQMQLTWLGKVDLVM